MTDPDKTIPVTTGRSPVRRITVVASLAAAAVIAVLLGVIVAFQSTDNVLSPSDVEQRLAADSSSAAAPSAAPSSTESSVPGRGTPSVLDTVAATITLTCDGDRIQHASWSIKPGYRLDERVQLASQLALKIESDQHDDVLVKAVCPAKVQVTAEPDDHGGGGKGHG